MIPLKIETLLQGRVVEQDRVEYKKGWNPSDIIHTICAFANDFTNTNGGYIVIGIEEQNGRPVLPPVGIDEDRLDDIQKELFQYCNLIDPRYIPQPEVVKYQGKWIIYLWCSAGANGPYKAPKDVYSSNSNDLHKAMSEVNFMYKIEIKYKKVIDYACENQKGGQCEVV